MTVSQSIAKELPLFKTVDDKELFLLIVGALSMRLISFRKACEILDTDQKSLLKLLDTVNLTFSFLDENDVEMSENGNIHGHIQFITADNPRQT